MLDSSEISSSDEGVQETRAAHTVAREVVRDCGDIVEIRIGKASHPGQFVGDSTIEYLRFSRTCRGGWVDFFLHSSDTSLCGRTVKARVVVMRRRLEDGRAFLYVDLIPVDASKRVNCKLALVDRGFGTWTRTKWPQFDTTDPIHGTIILAPANAEVRSRTEKIDRQRQPPSKSGLTALINRFA